MRLLFSNPKLYNRDCNRCLQFLYNEKTGEEEEEFPNQSYKRHKGCPPPCKTSEGCLKGTPKDPNTLSEENLQSYIHYRKCEATFNFPDDELVKQNAAIIKKITREYE